MGQYYSAYVGGVVFGQPRKFRETNDYDYYNGVKLMEHSWIGNTLCAAVSRRIYKNPCSVAWVGDYWDNVLPEPPNNMSTEKYEQLCKGADICDSVDYKLVEFDYDGKWAVNHTKKLAFRFDDLLDDDGCIIYPISLLTATSNGCGGGDYHSCYPCYDLCGMWCFDSISIEDNIPNGYDEIDAPKFIEKSGE